MSSISEWLDAAFVAFDNPALKDYNTVKKIAGKKRVDEQKTELQKFLEEESKALGFEEQSTYDVTQEVKDWRKKQERKRLRKKPKLSHYEKVKNRLKEKNYKKRIEKLKRMKK